ncbi:hypothetical protein ACVW1A_008298 [Bradyrhizobium sp. LB1.3]
MVCSESHFAVRAYQRECSLLTGALSLSLFTADAGIPRGCYELPPLRKTFRVSRVGSLFLHSFFPQNRLSRWRVNMNRAKSREKARLVPE